MIDEMEPSSVLKQIGFIKDRAPAECARRRLDRKSVSPDENLANRSGVVQRAAVPIVPSREQVCDRAEVPTESPVPTAAVDPAFAHDAQSNSDWVREIRKVWARGPASTLGLARVVSEARHALPRGEWTALWKARKMPFGRSKGAMLLRIWNGLSWANVQTFGHLPAGWSILYQLAKLDRATLEQLIEDGI